MSIARRRLCATARNLRANVGAAVHGDYIRDQHCHLVEGLYAGTGHGQVHQTHCQAGRWNAEEAVPTFGASRRAVHAVHWRLSLELVGTDGVSPPIMDHWLPGILELDGARNPHTPPGLL